MGAAIWGGGRSLLIRRDEGGPFAWGEPLDKAAGP